MEHTNSPIPQNINSDENTDWAEFTDMKRELA